MKTISSHFGQKHPPTGTSQRTAVRVWDLATRVFHWALLVCVSGAVVSAQVGGNLMDWHTRFGAATLGLIAFRVIWGLVGPRYARFRSFARSPSVLFSHVRHMLGSSQRYAGHSPSGALAVFAMLGVLLAQALSGLFSSDSIGMEGALVKFASESTVSLATSVHTALQWVIYGLVTLHVLAVAGYFIFKKDDLVGPMLHGDKRGIDAASAADSAGVRLVGLTLMGACLAAALFIFGG